MNYTILHALEGYDEVSLTCDFKTFSNSGEKIYDVESLGFEKIDPVTIAGGSTVEESAKIFEAVLHNQATSEQGNVVLVNAALAIQTLEPNLSFADCYYKAEESLSTGKALNAF